MELDKVKGMVPADEIQTSLKTRKAVKVITDSAVAVAPKAEEKTVNGVEADAAAAGVEANKVPFGDAGE